MTKAAILTKCCISKRKRAIFLRRKNGKVTAANARIMSVSIAIITTDPAEKLLPESRPLNMHEQSLRAPTA